MTREAEIRQTAAEWLRYNHPTCTQDMLVEAFRCGAEWADKHQISPWISVEERLPEENGKYYVLAAGIPDMALYKNGKWVTAYKERKNIGSHFVEEVEIQDFEYNHTDLTNDVTHWMPIPINN